MALANRGKRSIAVDVRTDDGTGRAAPPARDGRRVHHQPPTQGAAQAGPRRRGADRALPPPRVRAGPRLRGPRTRCRPGRLRLLGLLGPRRHGPHPHARRTARTRSTSAAPWATATGRWHWRSGSSAALLQRERTGQGSIVDVSLLATAMWTLSSDVLTALQGQTPPRPQGKGASPNPLVGSYRTSDGRHVQLVFLEGDRYWPALCEALGRPDLAVDARFTDLTAAPREPRRPARRRSRPSSVGAPSTSASRCWARSTPRGRRCNRSRSCSTTRR